MGSITEGKIVKQKGGHTLMKVVGDADQLYTGAGRSLAGSKLMVMCEWMGPKGKILRRAFAGGDLIPSHICGAWGLSRNTFIQARMVLGFAARRHTIRYVWAAHAFRRTTSLRSTSRTSIALPSRMFNSSPTTSWAGIEQVGLSHCRRYRGRAR